MHGEAGGKTTRPNNQQIETQLIEWVAVAVFIHEAVAERAERVIEARVG